MKRFEFLPHTADVYIAAYGRTLEEAFANAALAMFEVMTDTSRVEPRVSRRVRVEGFDLESLLYNWLEELLFLFDTESLLLSRFDVQEIAGDGGYRLRAEVWGERYDPSRHESRTLVKAATYNLMEITKTDEGYVLKFVVDI